MDDETLGGCCGCLLLTALAPIVAGLIAVTVIVSVWLAWKMVGWAIGLFG